MGCHALKSWNLDLPFFPELEMAESQRVFSIPSHLTKMNELVYCVIKNVYQDLIRSFFLKMQQN